MAFNNLIKFTWEKCGVVGEAPLDFNKTVELPLCLYKNAASQRCESDFLAINPSLVSHHKGSLA
jgi:hypothetical protein